MSTQIAYDPGNFYVWRASDGFAIHLGLKVVTQLNAQISGAGNDGWPGGMRGVLLGRTVETPFRATVIEDFKLLPAGAAGEPESDDALLEAGRQMTDTGNDRRAVGFFRAQWDGSLNIGQSDLQTFGRMFCEPGNVALLIQTSKRGNESYAALFYWQDGGPHPRDFGFGFPLDAAQLASGHPGWRYPDPLERTPLSAGPRAPEWISSAPVASAGRNGIRWWRLLPTAALVAIGIGALQFAMSSNGTVAAAAEPTETAASPTASRLGLNVTSRSHRLEIRWNRQSATIAASGKGMMKITEDGTTEAVPFDQSQLRDGYVSYTPRTNDVSIAFEVTGKDGGTTSESVRAVAIP